MNKRSKKYPLLPFSQLVYDSTRWMPDLYTIYRLSVRVPNIPLDFAKDGFEKVFNNHPVFGMRIDWRGRQYEKCDNETPFRGPYHKFSLYEKEGYLYIDLAMSRILGDEKSLLVLIESIIRQYLGYPLIKDNYWEYVEKIEAKKLSSHYQSSKTWLKNEYRDILIPVHPTLDRNFLFALIPPKANVYVDEYTILTDKITHFIQNEHLTLDGLITLCAGMAIAEYCDAEEAALTWAYEGRETEEEQHIFGSLHRDIPFHIKRTKDKKELIKTARDQIRSGIAHSDYPYTLTSPYSKRWNYAVNVIRITDIEEALKHIPLKVDILALPEIRYAYALLDVEIHENISSFNIVYRYSASHYKPESIKRFASLVRRNVEWLINNDD